MSNATKIVSRGATYVRYADGRAKLRDNPPSYSPVYPGNWGEDYRAWCAAWGRRQDRDRAKSSATAGVDLHDRLRERRRHLAAERLAAWRESRGMPPQGQLESLIHGPDHYRWDRPKVITDWSLAIIGVWIDLDRRDWRSELERLIAAEDESIAAIYAGSLPDYRSLGTIQAVQRYA